MLGVLIGTDSRGRSVQLRAYSGTTDYPELQNGWAATTRPTEITREAEERTFRELNALTRQIESFPIEALEEEWAKAKRQLDE